MKQHPYKWYISYRDIWKVTKIISYTFKNKIGTLYTVEITKYYGEEDVDVLFVAKPTGNILPTIDKMVNEGDVIKVMSTIVTIIKSYFKDNTKTKKFKFIAMKGESERTDNFSDNKRAKLYIAVAKAHGITDIKKTGLSAYVIKIKWKRAKFGTRRIIKNIIFYKGQKAIVVCKGIPKTVIYIQDINSLVCYWKK